MGCHAWFSQKKKCMHFFQKHGCSFWPCDFSAVPANALHAENASACEMIVACLLWPTRVNYLSHWPGTVCRSDCWKGKASCILTCCQSVNPRIKKDGQHFREATINFRSCSTIKAFSHREYNTVRSCRAVFICKGMRRCSVNLGAVSLIDVYWDTVVAWTQLLHPNRTSA